MTVLIAWGALSVGVVIGAMWKSVCERQSKDTLDIGDTSLRLRWLGADTNRWQRQRSRLEDWKRSA